MCGAAADQNLLAVARGFYELRGASMELASRWGNVRLPVKSEIGRGDLEITAETVVIVG